MKTPILSVKAGLFLLSLTFFVSCAKQNSNPGQTTSQDTTQVQLTEINRDSLLLDLTQQVLKVIKNKDLTLLAEYIHPKVGLRFSPYANVDTINHIKFTRDQFLIAVKNNKEFSWGHYDGSGSAIVFPIEGYFGRFVYDHDFLVPEKLSVNAIIGHGNSIDNLKQIYPVSDFTESYFSGFDVKMEGMDWSSLRLVFSKFENKLYLIGIIHDQATV
jgi:hypothetical protein